MIEVPEHPFFIGVQFHPELKSRPERVHPIFDGFIGAAAQQRRRRDTLVSGTGAGEAARGGRKKPVQAEEA